jgi:hypothetical protein
LPATAVATATRVPPTATQVPPTRVADVLPLLPRTGSGGQDGGAASNLFYVGLAMIVAGGLLLVVRARASE